MAILSDGLYHLITLLVFNAHTRTIESLWSLEMCGKTPDSLSKHASTV